MISLKRVFLIFATVVAHHLPGQAEQRIPVRSVLAELDAKIESKESYRADKERRIEALKFSLNDAEQNLRRAELCSALFDEYKAYHYDSAHVYAHRSLEYAELSDERDAVARATCDLLFCYSTVGFFREGGEIIKNFEVEGLAQASQARYYEEAMRYYSNLIEYVSASEQLQQSCREARDSMAHLAITSYSPRSFQRSMLHTEGKLRSGEVPLPEVAAEIESLLNTPNLSSHNKAILHAWHANVYEQMGLMEEAIRAVALSAIADIESCTYETTSAKVLANYMQQQGDITRANRYIYQALDDANLYNSNLRKLEIQAYLPYIAEQMREQQTLTRRNLTATFIAALALLLVVVLLLLKARRRNMSLALAQQQAEQRLQELEWASEQLQCANDGLEESNRIKDLYIRESLYGDSQFVDNVERLSKVIARKVKAKQYLEIADVLTEMGIKRERQRIASSFDTAFLRLYPNFIEGYNKLFAPEDAVRLGDNGEMTPEQRIFALMRLGIEDVNQVSTYLNLSPNTIYVYKAKVKARTIVPKEEFENLLKAIE